jgi:Transglutaminase-like superfamily
VRTFTVTLDSGIGAYAVRGTVDGHTLALQMGAGADATEQRLPISEPIYLPTSARARLRTVALAPDQTMTLRVFDPSAMEHQPLVMHVLGREALTVDGTTQLTWHMRETFRGAETSVWLDDAGRTLREEGPMGMVLQREDATRAVSAGWGDHAFDLMGAIAVRVHEPIAHPRDLASLTAHMQGVGDLPIPNDRRQSFHDGVLHIERESTLPPTYALPYADAEWRSELAATPFLQVDHPRIRAAAQDALGAERDPRRGAERLRKWVYDALEKRPVASIPNAVQVLEMRAGDCNEHAVLFAALARASGLPARVVAGVVYADGAFLYHAWDEVWLGSGWMSVDPTFDQMPADATHVKLVEGGPETHAALLAVIGKLAIDIVPERGSAGS